MKAKAVLGVAIYTTLIGIAIGTRFGWVMKTYQVDNAKRKYDKVTSK